MTPTDMAPAETTEDTRELTDGFHLVIDALKKNGINTIYNVPGRSDHRPWSPCSG